MRAAGCVFAEDEARLLTESAGTADELARLVARRVAGEPLEYVVGFTEFGGLRIRVEPGVFVPRRRTELLAAQAVAAIRQPRPVVVELCCGSGAVAAVVHSGRPDAVLHAADIDEVAVRCARRNLAGTGACVYQGDLTGPLPESLRGGVDVLVCNAPYVPTDVLALMPPEARLYESAAALAGGPDGLDVLRRVVAAAPDWLAPDGCLLVEAAPAQLPALVAAMSAVGLAGRVVTGDDPPATVVVARVQPGR